jgi:hypothetical protein
MNRKRKNPPHHKSLAAYEEGVNKVLDLLDVADTTKALGRISKIYKTIEEKETAIKELCDLLGVTHIGNAKNKINGLLRKTNERNIAEVYGLDYSFLSRNSKAWTMTIKGQDDPRKVIQQWEKNAECDRKMCLTAYFTGLEAAERAAQEANYDEVEVSQVVESWHDQMKEKYDELSAPEFWLEFKGSAIGVNVERSDKPPVALTEAIRMIQEYTHQTIYLDLISAGSSLGTVPRSQFNRWDSRFKSFEQMHVKEGVSLLKEFAAQITSYAVHRMVHGPQSWPTPDEEAKLFSILAPPEVNPYTAEFMVDDNSKLSEIMAHYYQLSGTNLSS